MLILLACSGPVPVETAGTSDTSDTSDTSGTAGGGWQWSECTQVLDVGTLGGIDTKLVYAPTVHRDGDTWRMWYAMTSLEGFTGIAHAVSADGVVWTDPVQVLPPAADGSWSSGNAGPSVLRVGEEWWMYVPAQGEISNISRCVSTDGFAWSGCTTVILPGLLDGLDDAVLSPHVIATGDTFRMYYTVVADDTYRIALAESPDGLVWTDHHLAIELGAEGSADTTSQYAPFVMQVGEEWRLLYSGRAPLVVEGQEWLVKRLVGATSPDGLAWEGFHVALDLACAGDADAWRLDEPWVEPDGDGWRLWYDGFDDPLFDEGLRRILTARSD